MQENNKKVGERFRKFLKRKRLKQKELGRQLHLSQQTVSSYCRNGKIPHHILLVLKTLFGLDIEWLLSGEKVDEALKENQDQKSLNLEKLLSIYENLSEENRASLLNYAQILKNEIAKTKDDCLAKFHNLCMIEVPFWGCVEKGRAIPKKTDWSGERIAMPSDILPTKNSEEYFCFQAKNDSMKNCSIYNNDYVVFIKRNTIEQGKVVFLAINDKILIGRIFFLKDYVEIHPADPDAEMIKLKNSENYLVEGVMVGLYCSRIF